MFTVIGQAYILDKLPNIKMCFIFCVGSVRRNRLLKKVTRAEVEVVVKLWLRFAVDRSGGRNARSRRSTRVDTVESFETDYSD